VLEEDGKVDGPGDWPERTGLAVVDFGDPALARRRQTKFPDTHPRISVAS